MAHDRCHAQPALAAGFYEGVAVQVQAIPAAGADGSDGMKESAPGDASQGGMSPTSMGHTGAVRRGGPLWATKS